MRTVLVLPLLVVCACSTDRPPESSSVVVLAALHTANSASQPASPDAWIGTWKVNLEKSTYGGGRKPTVATMIKVEQTADGIKMTFEGMNAQGQPFHNEVVATFDGKDHPVKGARSPDTTVAHKRIDSRTFETINKVDGKTTVTSRVVISADGKTWTATSTGINAQGEKFTSVVVADKQ